MPRPGSNVAFGDGTPSAGAPTDVSQWFVVGTTTKGAVGTAHKITSMAVFDSVLGPRLSGSVVRDTVEGALREGASAVYVSRVVGASPASSSHAFLGAASAPAITVHASSPGVWGDDLDAAILAPIVSGYRIQISANGTVLETSPDLADNDAAVAWGTIASYATVTKDGAAVPTAISATGLTGGDDDLDTVTDTEKIAALSAFPKTLGPGQLSFPGETDPDVLSAGLAHCPANNRVMLVDVPDSDVLADMTAIPAALRGDANASYGAAFGPWVSIPGTVPNTVRRIPYSGIEAGLIARAARQYNAGRAVAGQPFPLQYAVDFTDFTDDEHETALLAGLNLAKDVYGSLQTYGFRSLVDPAVEPDWVQFNFARLRMALSAALDKVAQGFVFEQIDKDLHKLQEFNDALSACVAGFGTAIWGYRVDTSYGDGLPNTAATVSAGEMHAVIGVQFSPHAEVVYIDVAKLPLNQTV